jgi:PKD repeat protein
MGRARNAGIWTQRVAIGAVVALVVAFAVRVGSNSAESLDFRDPLIWLTSTATGEVVQADSGSGDVTARVEVGDDGDSLDVVQRGSDAFVLNRTKGTIARVNGSTLALEGQAAVDSDPAARVLAIADHAGVATGSGFVPLDPVTGSPGAPVEFDGLSDAVLAADGTFWALDGTRQLLAVGAGGDRAEPVVVPGETRPFGLVTTAQGAYLVDGSGPSLRALDGRGPGLGGSSCVGGPIAAGSAIGGSRETSSSVVVMADADGATVRMNDLIAEVCTTALLGDIGDEPRFGTPVESGGLAFVPLESTGEIIVLSVEDGAVLGRYAVTGADRTIVLDVKDGTVWFNDPDGAAAGTIDAQGIVAEIDKYREIEVGGVTEDVATGSDAVRPGGTGGGTTTGAEPSGATTDTGDTGTEGSNDGVGNSADSTDRSVNSGRDDGPAEDTDLSGFYADFTYSKRVVEVGEVVTFSDRSPGGPTAWTWEFGDGTFSTGPDTSHSWDAVGAYRVTLRIEAPEGTASASVTIEVIDDTTRGRPIADFAFSASRIEVGQSVTFTDRSTGTVDELSWDFGDGNTSSEETVEHSWDNAGSYQVALTATNALGSDTSETVTITVYDRVQQPSASIEASTTRASINQTVTLVSRSTGNPTELSWGFGDGARAEGETVTHSWTTAGTYEVSLSVSNSAGSSEATITITIDDVVVEPVARIVASTNVAEIGQPVRFTSLTTNSPTRLTWDFDDGDTAVGTEVVHAFDYPGRFEVSLRASNDAGASRATTVITVLADIPPPVAGFVFQPEPASAGSPVQFTDTSGGGPVTRWTWNFGDGTATSSQRNPSHVFARAGTYTVRLTTENRGGTDDEVRQIVVLPPRPIASFSYSPTIPNAGQAVQFTDTTRGSDPDSWRWEFADLGTSTERNPTFTFPRNGSFAVTLVVRNAGGDSYQTRIVEVNPRPPVAAFSITPSTGITSSTPVRFAYVPPAPTVGGEPAEYRWTFPGGSTSSSSSPAPPPITFSQAGTYDVTLLVRNAGGSNQITQRITVNAVPSFTFSAPRFLAGQPVSFTNTSSGGPFTSVVWEWGDGTANGSGSSPTHTYAREGTYNARVTVFNGTTPSQSAVQAIRIYPVPTATITGPSPGSVVAGTPTTLTATVAGGDATWTVNGATVGTGASVPYTFPSAGDYVVVVTVRNAGGGLAEDDRTYRDVPAAAPVASFTAAHAPGAPNGQITFTSTSTPGTGLTFQWRVGSAGGPPAATTSTFTHTFAPDASAAARTVYLTVRDSRGRTDDAEMVVPGQSAASFSVSPAIPLSGQPITFTNTSSQGPFSAISWAVDGEPAGTGATMTRTFAAPGTYQVTITVTNLWGTATRTQDVVLLL